jgi:hypothetical protein
MKNISESLAALWGLMALTFVSCQKVIDIDLKNADQQYIIDALITDELGYNYVDISLSKPFDEDNVFARINDATIWIKDVSNNTSYPLVLGGNSRFNNHFSNSQFKANLGTTYELYVVVENDTFTATCTVPATKVPLDSLVITLSEFSMFLGRDMYNVVPVYTDPVGRGNYYLTKSFLNGVNYVSTRFDTDEFIDGQVNKSAVSFKELNFEDTTAEFVNGDVLSVELFCISKPVYDFYFTLAQNGSSAISNPANPKSNIYGKNVLGVFNAATVSRQTIVAEY